MKKIYWIFAIAVFSIAGSCKPEPQAEKGDLTLTFKAKYENEPLQLFKAYTAPDEQKIEFHVFNFFISDLELVDAAGKTVSLAEHKYVNFNSTTDEAKAKAGIELMFEDLPLGDYKEIRMGIGVKPSLNVKDPADFSSKLALGDAGNYWTAWNSYIFSRVEGRLDTMPTTGNAYLPYLYHSGVDGMYQSKVFEKIISLEKGSNEIVFEIQAKDFFFKQGAILDIKAINASHSGDVGTPAYEVAKQSVINITNAISIQ